MTRRIVRRCYIKRPKSVRVRQHIRRIRTRIVTVRRHRRARPC